MKARKISSSELKRMLDDEARKEMNQEVAKALVGPDGKPLNRRRRTGASKAMVEQALITALYKDGFIVTVGNEVHIDARKKIELVYGKNEIGENIRAILYKFVSGLHAIGTTVQVNGFRWEADDGLADDRADGYQDGDLGGIFSALQSGVCADGWSTHPVDARGFYGGGGDTDSSEPGEVQEDHAGSEGE